MAEFPGGGILGPIGNVVAAIGSLIGSFIGITAARLLEFLKLLKDYVLQLSKELLIGVFRTARAIARVLRTLATFAVNGVKTFAQWAYREIVKLHDFLAEKFGPVLRWLRELKQHIQDIYNRFVRPIIDTIQFIRQLNSLLQLFHINLLKKLDATLAQIEQRIEDPFIKLNQWINKVDNAISLIIDLDGIFQKVTLIKSMSRFAPSWLRIASNARSHDIDGDTAYGVFRANETQSVRDVTTDLGTYLDGGAVNIGEVINQATARAKEYYAAV